MTSDSDGAATIGWDAAKRLVQDVEDAFGAADLARIAQGFTEDAVARFADFPEMHGRDAIMVFLRARFARTRNYRLKKTLHVLMGDMLANTWDAHWEDAQTGKAMLGRGTEIWRVRDGRIALWDATFNVWEKGGPPATPVV
jgi:nuclear transport factor 2 (NTF2) superfamily protein